MTLDLKLNFVQLEYLDWLTELAPGKRMTSSQENRHFYFEEVEVEGGIAMHRIYPATYDSDKQRAKEILLRMSGRPDVDITSMYQAGFLKGYNSLGFSAVDQGRGRKEYENFVGRYVKDPFSYRERVYVPTRKAYDYMGAHGRDRLARLRIERDEKAAAVRRMILIGKTMTIRPRLPRDLSAQFPEGVPIPLPSRKIVRPYATAIVTKETAQRLYIGEINLLKPASESYIPSPIHGSEPNEYVSHDDVMVDNASPELVSRLFRIDAEFLEDFDRIAQQEIERMLPMFQSMADRLRQKTAEYEDMMREAFEPEDDYGGPKR